MFFMLLRLSQCAATGQDALPDPHRTLDHLCQRMDPNGPAGPLSASNDQDGARLGGGDSTDASGEWKISTSGAVIPWTLLTDSGTLLTRLGDIPRTLLTNLIA
jgi:hypothetical protein